MRLTGAFLAACALAASLAACGGHGPDPAACKKAMRAEFAAAIATGQKGTRPPECKGISDAQLQRFAAQIISGN